MAWRQKDTFQSLVTCYWECSGLNCCCMLLVLGSSWLCWCDILPLDYCWSGCVKRAPRCVCGASPQSKFKMLTRIDTLLLLSLKVISCVLWALGSFSNNHACTCRDVLVLLILFMHLGALAEADLDRYMQHVFREGTKASHHYNAWQHVEHMFMRTLSDAWHHVGSTLLMI